MTERKRETVYIEGPSKRGRVKPGWHKPIKSPNQLKSEKNKRNS